MKVVWLAKRHYTHKDALTERFGRVYQLPLEWADSIGTRLELLDYYDNAPADVMDGSLVVSSTPVRSLRALREMMRRITEYRPHIIMASGDCFIGLLAAWLARGARAHLVFDVYDDYREFGAHRAFLGWDAYGSLLRRASLVLYASQALADQHRAATPWHLVPNGIDPTMFQPQDTAQARRRIGMADRNRWIGYFGGMEPERGAADLIEAVGLLHKHDSSVRLVLCGKQHPDVALDRPWVDYRGSVKHASIPDFINACDVVTLPYRRGPIIDMASSCKIAEYLFCGRPVVATDTPNLLSNFPVQARELGDAICKPGDPADLARAIAYQLQNGLVASKPEQHTWAAIAQDTLAALQLLPRRD